MDSSLFTALRHAFPLDTDTPAISVVGCEPCVYTWRDLDEASAMLANLLVFSELPLGARVAVQTEKSVEMLLLYLAVLRAGGVFVPLNTGYQADEMRFFIEDAQPDILVCTGANFGLMSQIAFCQGVKHVFTLNTDRTGTLLQRASHHGRSHTPVPRAAHDLAAIVYTSGTTGRSKGAMLSHGNLLSNALILRDYWDWRADDVLMHVLPLFHVHGLFVACHAALLGGSRMIWLPQFDPAKVLEQLPHTTVFMGVPTLYTRLLAQAELNPLVCAGVRVFISGSAPLRPETLNEFFSRTGHTILERYGMSETLMLSSNPCRPSDGARRAGTVGRALPGVQLRITAKGTTLQAGETGHVEVWGPSVCQGYWRLSEQTQAAFTPDGWFKTGDLGLIDLQGYLSLVGRSKDLIITGGINVYPAEVEALINTLPKVLECAVIGIPHPDLGEAVVAVVVACAEVSESDRDSWKTRLKKSLAYFKCPKAFMVQAELPRNTMGKVQKSALRTAYLELFSNAATDAHQAN